jgi:predicted small lipoprotein YifL
MYSKPDFTNNSRKSFNWLLAALALALTLPACGETQPAAIPFSDIGARATANYQGDALSITATPDGARLRCGFQKLDGHATPEGLWLESTRPGGGQLRLVAVAVGRGGSRACPCTLTEAASSVRSDMSIVAVPQGDQAPLGAPWTHGAASCFDMPLLTELETTFSDVPFYRHAAPSGAIACLRQDAHTLARTGKISAEDKLVRFTRPGLTEEYSVSVDGVRQDFVIAAPPAGAGDLRVELALSGARAEAPAGGVRLRLDGSGRALAYGRLRVEDATGRELTARLEVLAADRLAVSVADANAIYPVRIDPTFSDADWVSLGSGINGWVAALAMSGTDLYAGGQFTTAGGVPASNIAKWNGSAWSALGSGMNNAVIALALSGTDLYAGGYFTRAGEAPANYIAKWDGSAWSAVGSGTGGSTPKVSALAVIGTNLYAGGEFTAAGGVTANYIAAWNGSAWSGLGSGMNANGYVNALAVSGTDLYAGGFFTAASGVPANYIAKWNGSAWSALGSGMSDSVWALAVSGTDLYAGGFFTTAGGVPASNIAKWNGSVWAALGSGVTPGGPAPGVCSMAVSGTDLYAGGFIRTAGGLPASNIAKWDGSAWSALGSGMNSGVNALASDGADHLFVGGSFSLAGTNVYPYIAEAILAPRGPTILKPPLTQSAEAGATVHLAVNATGEPSPVYQWYFNRTNLLSCASSDLVLTNILFSQSGTYTVVVTNVHGAVTSAPVMLNAIVPVPRRLVPGVTLMGQVGNPTGLDYRDNLGPTANWQTMATMTLSNASQYYFDVSEPLPPQRYYRAWQTGTPSVMPFLDLHLVPAITLAGNIGHSVRVDYINQFGPTDAWVTLDTVTLTNTPQLYFDTSAWQQPPRLYRHVP